MISPTYIDGVPVSWSRILGAYVVREPWTARRAVNHTLGLAILLLTVLVCGLTVFGGLWLVVDLVRSAAG